MKFLISVHRDEDGDLAGQIMEVIDDDVAIPQSLALAIVASVALFNARQLVEKKRDAPGATRLLRGLDRTLLELLRGLDRTLLELVKLPGLNGPTLLDEQPTVTRRSS